MLFRSTWRALDLGAWGIDSKSGPMELNIPAIKGVGDSLVYLVDRWRGKNGAKQGDIGDISIYDVDFEPLSANGSILRLKINMAPRTVPPPRWPAPSCSTRCVLERKLIRPLRSPAI